MKKCSSCGLEKTFDQFNKNNNTKDGYRYMCKECRKQYDKILKDRNPDKVLARYAKYNHSEKGKKYYSEWAEKNRDKIIEAMRRFRVTLKGKISSNKHTQKYGEKYPEKRRAKTEIYKSVSAGRIPKVSTLICSRCHEKPAAHYHHPDYSKPLEVVPLCIQCHVDIHHKS